MISRSFPGLSSMRHQILVAAATVIGGWGASTGWAQQSEFEQMLRTFGNLETVAGIGVREEDDSQNPNLWNPDFEGAGATTIELSNPHMTMADQVGNLYVADKESHSILKIDTKGIATTVAGTHTRGFNGESGVATAVQLSAPNGLFVLRDGTFYILDSGNRRVRRVDLTGAMTTVLHDTGSFGPGRGLWVSPDETTIFYNGPGRVMRWTKARGSEEFVSGISDPGNITVDPQGNLVVTSRGAHLVYRVNANGERTIIAGDGSDDEPVNGRPATSVGLEDVRGIAFRPDGSYFVCTQKGGDVVFVDRSGIANIIIPGKRSGNTHAGDGLPPETPGDKISEPRAISLAPNGDLIITTNDNGFVRVLPAIPPPTNFTVDFGTNGKIALGWDTRDGVLVDVEQSSLLNDWTPAATDLTAGSFEAELGSQASGFFQLRAHRPYSEE